MAQRTEREIARELLRLQRHAEAAHSETAEHLERGRLRTIELARRYALSWEEIGAELMVKGNTARMQYERGL